MIICVDCDNILNNLTEMTLKLYNADTSKSIKMSDITTYNFSECLEKEDADKLVELFKEKRLWDSLTPLPGSQKYLKKLVNQGHRVYVATATDPINFAWKVDWITKHFPFIPADNIIRIMDKSLLKTDVLIDDSLDNLTNSFCERICLDCFWNQNEIKDYAYSIIRAHNLTDIVNIVNDLEKEMREWGK